MDNNLQEQVTKLEEQVKNLTDLVNANEYSNLSVFLKQVLMKSSLTVNGSSTFNGNIGFFGTTPAGQQSRPTNPSGGTTIDSQARTAITQIINILINLGITN